MSGYRWKTGILLIALGSSFSECDCRSHQPATTCWTHEGAKTDVGACSNADREPNDTLPTAANIPVDCATLHLQGSLAPGDIDVYHTSGKLCSDSIPTASWDATGARLCIFAGCFHGIMSFSGCPEGTSAIHFREGILGCCVEGPGTVTLDAKCGALETVLETWMVVDRGAGSSCTEYDIAYHD